MALGSAVQVGHLQEKLEMVVTLTHAAQSVTAKILLRIVVGHLVTSYPRQRSLRSRNAPL